VTVATVLKLLLDAFAELLGPRSNVTTSRASSMPTLGWIAYIWKAGRGGWVSLSY
jgi:hypothetical protein